MPEVANLSETVRPIRVLLVEDDDDDVFLMQKCLEKDRLLVDMFRVEDGAEAMHYLRQEGQYANARTPELILLDLNMPRKDGREVLREIKADPTLRFIPVVVLTTSEDEQDVLNSYLSQANSYVTKPVDLGQFREILQTMQNYWFSVVRLPSAN